ncbi:MAG: DUF4160 domain-containing protein [Gammaproteobacteria bacterium]|nr:DUF4160 domain-containing protein [Gammaproteobacteria bacterium]
MPTILKIGPYRFFFYSNERGEPSHIHVQRERFLAKFWLNPVALAGSKRFASHELRTIQKHVDENREIFLEAWNEHISN